MKEDSMPTPHPALTALKVIDTHLRDRPTGSRIRVENRHLGTFGYYELCPDRRYRLLSGSPVLGHDDLGIYPDLLASRLIDAGRDVTIRFIFIPGEVRA
jgi:hypothetical protein